MQVFNECFKIPSRSTGDSMKLSEIKRLQILDAAETLFYEHGVEQTSMDQLAAQAKVSKRTVYNHFSNKEELFQAIIFRMKKKLSLASEVIYVASQPIESQLSQIAQNEVALLSSEPFLRVAKITFIQLLKDPKLAKMLSEQHVGCLSYLESFLSAACDDGCLTIDDPAFASKQFVFQLKSFVFYPLLYGFEAVNEVQKQRVINETVDLFLARYKATS